MTTIARRRIAVRERRDPVLSALAGIGNAARWLAGLIPEPRVIERFSGSNGVTDDNRTPYDQMTTAEHDEAGAIWACHWYEDD